MANTIQFIGRSKFLAAQVRKLLREMLQEIAINEGYELQSLVYVFQTDEELLEINENHLQHDDYTDIITFDLSDIEASIDGEIYISIDRVNENAKQYGVSFNEELVRVVAHGLLHLCGYKDKSEKESQEMRNQEEIALDIYRNLNKKMGTA